MSRRPSFIFPFRSRHQGPRRSLAGQSATEGRNEFEGTANFSDLAGEGYANEAFESAIDPEAGSGDDAHAGRLRFDGEAGGDGLR